MDFVDRDLGQMTRTTLLETSTLSQYEEFGQQIYLASGMVLVVPKLHPTICQDTFHKSKLHSLVEQKYKLSRREETTLSKSPHYAHARSKNDLSRQELLEAFGDGPRNSEPGSSVTKMAPELAPSSPNFYTTTTGGRLNTDRFNVHRPPPHGGFLAASGSNS
ncbi:hypothetical protein TNCV_2697761 [Trichonephila clavipes]|nr:hypothetical protein TNCV_2697761 [Trichonephila clavipes]